MVLKFVLDGMNYADEDVTLKNEIILSIFYSFFDLNVFDKECVNLFLFSHVELLLNHRCRIVRLFPKRIWPHCGVSTTMGKVLIAEYYFFSVEKSCTRN